MKPSPLLFPLVIAAALSAAASPVELEIAPGGKFDVNYQLSTGPSAAAVLNISGNLSADLEVTDGAVSKFKFLGGNIAYSDTTLNLLVSTFPITATVRILTRGVVASVSSTDSTGEIHPLTGVISNTGHRLIQDRGTVTTRYIVGSTTLQEDIRNLATEPDGNPLVGVTTVTGTLLENLDYKAHYRINFSHSRDETRVQPAEEVGGTVSIREVGGFTASKEVWLPGPAFVTWAMTNYNQRPDNLTDRSTTNGQPLVLLYAFAAAAGPWSPPLTFAPVNGQVWLELPPDGLQAPVRVEYSSSLKDGEWVPLTRGNNTSSVFTTGESGPVVMNLPSGEKGFIRLALAD